MREGSLVFWLETGEGGRGEEREDANANANELSSRVVNLLRSSKSSKSKKIKLDDDVESIDVSFIFFLSSFSVRTRTDSTLLRSILPSLHQESIYLYVNFDKFTLQIRNEVSRPLSFSLLFRFVVEKSSLTRRVLSLRFPKLVVKAASDRFNVEAGLVVDAMLKATKDTQLKITEIKTGGSWFSFRSVSSPSLTSPSPSHPSSIS